VCLLAQQLSQQLEKRLCSGGDPVASVQQSYRELADHALPGEMTVGIIEAPLRAETKWQSVSKPGPGEILVCVQGCGICGSNLPVWEGRPWFTYPLPPGAPGHEAWGIVELVGPEVTNLRPGDRVALLADRGFAEFVVAPAKASLLLPEELDDMPFPGEPLACAMNIARRSKFEEGETVAIVGIGFLGALLTRLARLAGAQVTAISRRPFARAIAESFGANATCEWDENTGQRVLSANGGNGFDCVIESTGLQNALDLASQLTRERGRMIIAGYHQDSPRHVDMQLWNWRGIDVINAHEREQETYLEGMRLALDAILDGSLDPSPLYTHAFPLPQLGGAFEALRSRPDGFMKALVLP
jgi:threonine dehydrogenase-like Zn-dependent dehydrogenase